MARKFTTRGWYGCYYAADCHPITEAEAADPGKHGLYGSYIYAERISHARELATKRGLGEYVYGLWQPVRIPPKFNHKLNGRRWPYIPPSTMLGWKRSYWERKAARVDFLHAVTFLSFIAVRAKVIRADIGVLGDQGLLHEAVHCMLGHSITKAKMQERLLAIESEVPGYLPPNWAAQVFDGK